MKKIILIYGLVLAALTLLLQWWDYRFMLHEVSLEVYVSIIAAIFTGVGIWLGLKITGRQKSSSTSEEINQKTREELDISNRELDVLKLMALGYSNREIADALFISENTVKTHSSNLYSKLAVQRRTQAVNKARILGLV